MLDDFIDPATLSRLMREIHQLGLQYQKHQIETSGNESRISLSAVAEPNCDPEERTYILSVIDKK